MYDEALVREIIHQMLEAIQRIERRFAGLKDPDEFLDSDAGIDRLDAICMMLIAVGESCKNLDKVTRGELFSSHAEVDWKGVSGMRDIISHHYFDVDATVVFSVCAKHIPSLKRALEAILADLGT
jgi:uncharacterized protein with HEPN domain